MIRPTFLAFETAKRALNVAQAGLDTVGHNIANVHTPGYTRQRVDQVSLHSTYKNKFQVHGSRAQNSGQGADIVGISQIRDPYLDTRYRNEAAANGELVVKSAGLTDLENVIDEISSTGLVDKLQNFIDQITKYAQNADSAEIAEVVRNAAQQVVQTLNKTAGELAAVGEQQRFDLDIAIQDDVNSSLRRIAILNREIRESNMHGNPANELNDERNLLIDQLANYLPIRVTRTPEQIADGISVERVSIQLVDESKTPIKTFDLVNSSQFNQLGMSEDENGFVSIQLIEGMSGFTLAENINENLNTGGLKGYLDLINGQGDFAGKGENTYRGVPYYQKSLDVFANTFARYLNEANSVTQEEADKTQTVGHYPEKHLFTAIGYPKQTTNENGSLAYDTAGRPIYDWGTITAANITISDNWMAESSFLTTSKQDYVPVQKKDADGELLFDNDGNPVYETQANSDNLLVLKALLTDSDKSFMGVNNDGVTFPLFKGSMEEQLVGMQSTLGLDKSFTDSMLDASNTVIGGYADQRDAISAVSIDEEAINMMTYQNYYNAAARYMTTLDEALGTIIQNMGVVGR